MPEAPEPPDDPRLTAYALGELGPAEAALVEAEIADRPEARALVVEIQATARLLADHLRLETAPSTILGLHRAIDARLGPAAPPHRRKWVRPALAAGLLGLAATATWAVLDGGGQPREGVLLAGREPAAASPKLGAAPAGTATGALPAQAPAPPPGATAEPDSDLVGTSPRAAVRLDPLGVGSKPGASAAAKSDRSEPVARVINGGFRRWGALAPAELGKAKTFAYRARLDASAELYCSAERQPTSTFPAAPGSESYARVAADLDRGVLPPREAVRTEELINALAYSYAEPPAGDPIGCEVEVARCPWDEAHRLVRVGLKGREPTRDVAVAVRFHPDRASAYRLFGLDDPVLPALEAPLKEAALRAGQGFTALYEVIPPEGRGIAADFKPAAGPPKLLDVEVRCKVQDASTTRLLTYPGNDSDRPFVEASADFRLASALAGFAMLLRDSPGKGSLTWVSLVDLATAAVGPNPAGDRARFLELCRKAQALSGGR